MFLASSLRSLAELVRTRTSWSFDCVVVVVGAVGGVVGVDSIEQTKRENKWLLLELKSWLELTLQQKLAAFGCCCLLIQLNNLRPTHNRVDVAAAAGDRLWLCSSLGCRHLVLNRVKLAAAAAARVVGIR